MNNDSLTMYHMGFKDGMEKAKTKLIPWILEDLICHECNIVAPDCLTCINTKVERLLNDEP